MKKLLIVVLSLFTLTGCYNYIELSDLGIVSSILINYENNIYKIKLELYDDEEVMILKGSGKTITEALENAESETDKIIYYQHMNVVFINDSVNLDDVIYYFLRNPNINNSFYLVYTDTLDIYKDDDINVGKTVKDHLVIKDYYSFFDVLNNYVNKEKDLYLPIYNGDKINGIITLHNDKFITTLSNYEEGIIKILANKNGSNIYSKCNDDYFLLKVDSIKVKYDINDSIKIKINIKANIEEYTCGYDTTKISTIETLQKDANNSLEQDINKLLTILTNNETDLLGINTMINNKYHDLDKKFNNFNYEIEPDIHIYKKGLLLK